MLHARRRARSSPGPQALPRVAILESRMSREVARLVERHGGEPVCVPTVRESHDLQPHAASRLIDSLVSGQFDMTVFMTGVAVSTLFEVGDQIGRRAELVSGLRRVTTVCRGPKPTAALRGFGVTPTITAASSYTTAEVIDALAGIDLRGRRVLLFHYGERSETLAETLRARDEQWIYRWHLPEDVSAIEELVGSMLEGRIDAVAVTCQIQFRHLFQIAETLGREHDLVQTLNRRMVVAAVGPTCSAILRSHGVAVHVVPDNPKMGPLIVALMRYLEQPAPQRLAAAR
jgi:uroporphyrinogen-III synthase